MAWLRFFCSSSSLLELMHAPIMRVMNSPGGPAGQVGDGDSKTESVYADGECLHSWSESVATGA